VTKIAGNEIRISPAAIFMNQKTFAAYKKQARADFIFKAFLRFHHQKREILDLGTRFHSNGARDHKENTEKYVYQITKTGSKNGQKMGTSTSSSTEKR